MNGVTADNALDAESRQLLQATIRFFFSQPLSAEDTAILNAVAQEKIPFLLNSLVLMSRSYLTSLQSEVIGDGEDLETFTNQLQALDLLQKEIQREVGEKNEELNIVQRLNAIKDQMR